MTVLPVIGATGGKVEGGGTEIACLPQISGEIREVWRGSLAEVTVPPTAGWHVVPRMQ